VFAWLVITTTATTKTATTTTAITNTATAYLGRTESACYYHPDISRLTQIYDIICVQKYFNIVIILLYYYYEYHYQL